MHLHNCRCFQEHLRMLLQSLRALCLSPGGSGSIWKCLEALVRLPGVSGRIACGFQSELHFADIFSVNLVLLYASVIPVSPYAPHWLPTVKFNGGGGEKQIFSPQRPPSESLHSLNWRLHVLLRLCSSTVCRQIDLLYIY